MYQEVLLDKVSTCWPDPCQAPWLPSSTPPLGSHPLIPGASRLPKAKADHTSLPFCLSLSPSCLSFFSCIDFYKGHVKEVESWARLYFQAVALPRLSFKV